MFTAIILAVAIAAVMGIGIALHKREKEAVELFEVSETLRLSQSSRVSAKKAPKRKPFVSTAARKPRKSARAKKPRAELE